MSTENTEASPGPGGGGGNRKAGHAHTSVCTAEGRCFRISRTTSKRLKLGGIVWDRERECECEQALVGRCGTRCTQKKTASYLGQQQLPHVIHSTQDTCSSTASADKQESEQTLSQPVHDDLFPIFPFCPPSASHRFCHVAQASLDLLTL